MAAEGAFPKDTSSVIFINDYNNIQNAIKTVKTDFYGIGCVSSQLTKPRRIQAVEWNNLRTDIDACIRHQTGSDTTISTKDGTKNVTAADINLYWGAANAALVNKSYVYEATQLAFVPNAATSSRDGVTAPWIRSISHYVRVQWASADKAAKFFNTGGYLTINAGYSGGSNAKDIDWQNIIKRVGTRVYVGGDWFSSSVGVSQTIAQIYGGVYGYSSQFSPNYYKITATNIDGTALRLQMQFQDDYATAPDQTIGMTISSSVGYKKSVDGITGPWPGITTTGNL
jgi:hypothetical protein